MDFNSVLSLAKTNKQDSSSGIPVKRYSTDMPPPKKSQKSNVQSDAIRSFLAKKQKEEDLRARDADRRKQDLLELRAIAKNNRKANAMAKRTKDNNFMSTVVQPEQLTQEAAAEKLSSQDTSDRYRYFKPARVGADPSVIADRPKMKSIEPPPQPHPVRSHNGHRVRADPPQPPPPPPRPVFDSRSHDHRSQPNKKRPVTGVNRRPGAAPPPPNFYDLLKLAEKKQHEPVELPKIPKKTVKDVDVQGRPMTSDEKRRFLEEQTRKQGRSLSTVSVPYSARKRRRFRENEEREQYVAETLVQPKSTPAEKPSGGSAKGSAGGALKKPVQSQGGKGPERTKVSNGEQRGFRDTQPPRDRAPNGAVRRDTEPSRDRAPNGAVRRDIEPSGDRAPNGAVRRDTEPSRDRAPNGAVRRDTEPSRGDALKISKVWSLAGQNVPPKMDKRPCGQPKVDQSNRVPTRPSAALERDPIHCRPVKTKPGSSVGDRARASLPEQRQIKTMRGAPVTNGRVDGTPTAVKRSSFPPRGDEPRPRIAPSQSRELPPKPSAGRGVLTKRPPAEQDVGMTRSMSREEYVQRRLAQQELLERRFRQTDGPRPKAFPPQDAMPKQFPPRDLVPRRFPPEDARRPPARPVKRRIESDDEYDEEMDDFIDDGPLEDGAFNISEHIKEIFGYDRSRYRYEPEDDVAMESSFTQMMREEAISTKMGILEDLEDIRREQLELERKAKLKKKK